MIIHFRPDFLLRQLLSPLQFDTDTVWTKKARQVTMSY